MMCEGNTQIGNRLVFEGNLVVVKMTRRVCKKKVTGKCEIFQIHFYSGDTREVMYGFDDVTDSTVRCVCDNDSVISIIGNFGKIVLN